MVHNPFQYLEQDRIQSLSAYFQDLTQKLPNNPRRRSLEQDKPQQSLPAWLRNSPRIEQGRNRPNKNTNLPIKDQILRGNLQFDHNPVVRRSPMRLFEVHQ